MRLSYDTLKLLIDFADPEAYRAWFYSKYETMKNTELWTFDNGLFYLYSRPLKKWYSCVEYDFKQLKS